MTDTWETREVCLHLSNDESMYNSNMSADELEVMLTPNFEDDISGSFLQAAYSQVDWDVVAECVSDGSIECCECFESGDEEYASENQWKLEDGDWYCKECRPDFETCDGCSESFPEASLKSGICEECLAEEEEEEAEEVMTDICGGKFKPMTVQDFEDEAAGIIAALSCAAITLAEEEEEEVEEVMTDTCGGKFKIGDFVNKPDNVTINKTYDYGVVRFVSPNPLGVDWFKWGFVPEPYRDGLTVVYQTENPKDLVKVDVEAKSHVVTCVLDLAIVRVGDEVYQINAKRHGTIKVIYSLLKEPTQIRLAVETSTGMRLWEVMHCRKWEV